MGKDKRIYFTSDYLEPLTSGTSCSHSDVGGLILRSLKVLSRVLGLKVSIMMVLIFFLRTPL